jgi:chemotaxis protein MotA
MDIFSIIGFLAFGSLLLGAFLDGAHLTILIQPPAFLIVVPSTLLGVLGSVPAGKIGYIIKALKMVFSGNIVNPEKTKEEILEIANKARKEGILSLESSIDEIKDPLIKRGVELMVLGMDEESIVSILEAELTKEEEELKIGVEYWKTCSETSPTMGLTGAVFGLMHALTQLNDPNKLAEGISTAFVATVYGITSSYLIFGPWGRKSKAKLDMIVMAGYMTIEGIRLIAKGENPRLIEEKLNAYA